MIKIQPSDLEMILTAYAEQQLAEDLSGELEEEVNVDVSSFQDAGILTNDSGLVIKVNGREFQLTIVRSK